MNDALWFVLVTIPPAYKVVGKKAETAKQKIANRFIML